MNESDKKSFNLANVFSLLMVIASWAWIVYDYQSLPLTIALQFDSGGEVSKTGPTYMIFILPVIYTYAWLMAYRLDRFRSESIELVNKTPILRILVQMLLFAVMIFILKLTLSKS